jgi:hypothetical protein
MPPTRTWALCYWLDRFHHRPPAPAFCRSNSHLLATLPRGYPKFEAPSGEPEARLEEPISKATPLDSVSAGDPRPMLVFEYSFLFVFLPLVLVVYFALPQAARNLVGGGSACRSGSRFRFEPRLFRGNQTSELTQKRNDRCATARALVIGVGLSVVTVESSAGG